MGYKHLDYRKRCEIYGLWRAGYSATDIAKEVGVHKSTISREFNRNITFVRTKLGSWQYKPNYAQGYANERHKKKRKHVKFTDDAKAFVCEKIQENWSPDQISGYAKRQDLFSISNEWIYQFVLRDKEKGEKLYLHLRHQNKRYRKRYGSPKRQHSIQNRRFIDDRPAIVNDKVRIGDWEIDTIIGKQHKQAIVSIVDRVSKKTILKKVPHKTAKLVTEATISALRSCSHSVHSITSDNGSEFAYHEQISKELNTDFYFAHPYSSWERGLNENTNGLVRQYIKKGADISSVTDDDLIQIANELNNRPRKTLDYATPNEVIGGHQP